MDPAALTPPDPSALLCLLNISCTISDFAAA
jgi:hypothetical protein